MTVSETARFNWNNTKNAFRESRANLLQVLFGMLVTFVVFPGVSIKV